MDNGNFPPLKSGGEFERPSRHPLRIRSGNYFQTLDHARLTFVFQHRIFPFRILTYYNDVDVLIFRSHAGSSLPNRHVDVQIQIVTDLDVRISEVRRVEIRFDRA